MTAEIRKILTQRVARVEVPLSEMQKCSKKNKGLNVFWIKSSTCGVLKIIYDEAALQEREIKEKNEK